MLEDIQDILIDRYTIQARVYKMAQQIAGDFGEREFVLMPLLTGSIIFLADLVRHLPIRMKIDVMAVSSYPGKSTTNQGTRVLYPTTFNVAGKNVLVIDDILDTGRTLVSVRKLLLDQGAADVRTCVLLQKKLPSPPAINADYVGFQIPDEFVVGYGLDFAERYRNLPCIGVLKPRYYAGKI